MHALAGRLALVYLALHKKQNLRKATSRLVWKIHSEGVERVGQ